MDYKEAVSGFEDEGGTSDLRIDLLRVLVAETGPQWKSDLIRELQMFRKETDRQEEVQEESLEDALRELESGDLVEIENRKKATREGGSADALISLTDPSKAEIALSKDEILKNYRSKVKKAYGE